MKGDIMIEKKVPYQINEDDISKIRQLMLNINRDKKKEELQIEKMKLKANIFDVRCNINEQLEFHHEPEIQHLYYDQLKRVNTLEDILSQL